jgi:hypothetical protein
METLSGDNLLRGTYSWDIDGNDAGNKKDADLWWEHVDEHERYLVPMNGAQLTVVRNRPFEQVTLDDLQKTEFASDRISASDANPTIIVGTVLAVRTSKGNLTKLEVVGFEPLTSRKYIAKYDMRLRYVLYEVIVARPANRSMTEQAPTQ